MPLYRKFEKAEKYTPGRAFFALRGQEKGAELEIRRVFENWIAAVSTGTPDAVARMYADDAVLLPTLSPLVHDTPQKRRAYFQDFTSKPNLKGTINETHIRVFGDVAVNSGIYTFSFNGPDGKKQEVPARFSFVYRKMNSEWKIIEHHSSASPNANGAVQPAVNQDVRKTEAERMGITTGKRR